MINLFDLASKDYIEFVRHISSITYMFSLKIEFRLKKTEERFGFLVFQMQLNKEVTFDHVSNFIFRLFVNVLHQSLLDIRVQVFMQS